MIYSNEKDTNQIFSSFVTILQGRCDHQFFISLDRISTLDIYANNYRHVIFLSNDKCTGTKERNLCVLWDVF